MPTLSASPFTVQELDGLACIETIAAFICDRLERRASRRR
jgi:hypothetical protein